MRRIGRVGGRLADSRADNGQVGTTLVSVSANADLGESVRAVSAVLDVTVQAAEVVSVGSRRGSRV